MELCLNIPRVIIYYVLTRGDFSFHRILYSIGTTEFAFSQTIKYSVTK